MRDLDDTLVDENDVVWADRYAPAAAGLGLPDWMPGGSIALVALGALIAGAVTLAAAPDVRSLVWSGLALVGAVLIALRARARQRADER